MTKKILVVDDTEGVRRELSYLLEDHGYTVTQAEDGNEAYGYLITQHFDLVITDILMPKMDGFELSAILANSFPQIKIIAITGGGKFYSNRLQGIDDLLRQAEKIIKPDAIFKKPFENEKLIEQIELLLKTGSN